MRRSLLKILTISPEERAAFSPQNGFQEIAKSLVDAPSKGKDGSIAVSAWREITETLGERVGSNSKDSQERNKGSANIVNDLVSPNLAN